jgi:pimeloyl-ACP methyl ester carboxylesterase
MIKHLPGIETHRVSTPRLQQYVLASGGPDGVPVILVHGNASSSTFWEEAMLALPSHYRALAPDMRGYGLSEAKQIDARRGFDDWVQDFEALLATLSIERFHLIGHSLGGTFVFNWIARRPESVLSACVVCPGSPYGYGGCHGLDGRLTHPDGAGSGGGIANQEFARLMAQQYRGTDSQAAPRLIMRQFYFHPPFVPAREEDLLSSLLQQQVGPQAYPGDFRPSQNWPLVAPGQYGPLNMVSPLYRGDSVERFVQSPTKPPVLWIRGTEDQIVSDASLFEMGHLGKLGLIPGYPGEKTYPPQPMVAQTREVLRRYQVAGGSFSEVEMKGTGHTPYLEQPHHFYQHWHPFLRENSPSQES